MALTTQRSLSASTDGARKKRPSMGTQDYVRTAPDSLTRNTTGLSPARAADATKIEDTYPISGIGTANTMPKWLENAPDMGGTPDLSSDSYYDRYLREQQSAINQRTNAAVDANNAYIPQINQQSDKALQDAYILREQNRVNAPQALSALGYTGGASETALMGINTGYENSRNQIEQNRAASLGEIRQNEQRIRATGDATLAEAGASYYDKLISAQQAAAAQQQDQANWQAEFELQQQEYEDAAAQQQWQNAYDERLLGLKTATATKTGTSGGSSGTRSSGSTADKNTSGNYNVVLNNVKRALGGSNAGSQTAWNAAINYIQNSLRQGMITEYEANQMINTLGLS